jgi:hypothetical protein
MQSGLRRDKDWRSLDGEICRVNAFTPLDSHPVRGLPYASIEIDSPALAEPATGFVTHRVDFRHLWRAFNVRGVADDEEVIVVWNKSKLKGVARLLSSTMPGLLVWVCPKHAYELMTDPSFRPELDGAERHRAASPLITWEP